MNVLDLFSGMGGFSLGFREAGFEVRGVDKDPRCVAAYRQNIGDCQEVDLSQQLPDTDEVDVLIGGPPCRPWSRLNVSKSRLQHPDRPLIQAFEQSLITMLPSVFIMENVPLLEKDELFTNLVQVSGAAGYHCYPLKICYADYGAPTRRTRLFLFGARGLDILGLIAVLLDKRCSPKAVWEVIGRFKELPRGGFPDHEWAEIKTMWNYLDKYSGNRYGWYRLDKNLPAPSFGNIQKTYVLHPDSWDGMPPRVLSVREAMAILGFSDEYRFPEEVAITARYRMVADAVCPVFSRKLAQAVKEFLTDDHAHT